METRNATPRRTHGGKVVVCALAAFCAPMAMAQPAPMLTLRQAETMALQNHPQIQAAQNEAAFANQQIVEQRSAYYPTVNADITGSGANHDARIGAGFLTDSRLFNRYGQGFRFTQLITDVGRTKNLVASSRLQAQASAQNVQATRYEVLLQVNQAYFDVLHAQALIKTAQETITTRQTLLNQVTQLAQNQLRSQLDVSFADVNVSEAKLLLIRAQNSLDDAYAELARAHRGRSGSRLSGPGRAACLRIRRRSPDDLVAQAMANRPELASFRFSRDSAYKFAEAEKDLNRPTVNAGRSGRLYPLHQRSSPRNRFPRNMRARLLNVSIPIFNGHLFTARREAALDRAMEADQKLRDEQLSLSRDVRLAWANAIDCVSANRRDGPVRAAGRPGGRIWRRDVITSVSRRSSSCRRRS